MIKEVIKEEIKEEEKEEEIKESEIKKPKILELKQTKESNSDLNYSPPASPGQRHKFWKKNDNITVHKNYKPEYIMSLLSKNNYQRTKAEIRILAEYLSEKYEFFKKLKTTSEIAKLEKICSVLHLEEFKPNSTIIKFGEEGDKFYILLDGRVNLYKPSYPQKIMNLQEYLTYIEDVRLEEKDDLKIRRILDKNSYLRLDMGMLMAIPISNLTTNFKLKVFVEEDEKLGEFGDGFAFGEIALIKKTKRNATIKAKKFCKLACINKNDYNKIIKELEEKRLEKVLKQFKKNYPLFDFWTLNHLIRLMNCFSNIYLFPGDYLFKQNEESDAIYIIKSGKFEIYSYVSLGWINQFYDYIIDSKSNLVYFLLNKPPVKEKEITDIINLAKKKCPLSPMKWDPYKGNKITVSFQSPGSFENLQQEKLDSVDPLNLFKVKIRNTFGPEVLGFADALEMKNRFCFVKCVETASIQKVKLIDFFKLVNLNVEEENKKGMMDIIAKKKRHFYIQLKKGVERKIEKEDQYFDKEFEDFLEKKGKFSESFKYENNYKNKNDNNNYKIQTNDNNESDNKVINEYNINNDDNNNKIIDENNNNNNKVYENNINNSMSSNIFNSNNKNNIIQNKSNKDIIKKENNKNIENNNRRLSFDLGKKKIDNKAILNIKKIKEIMKKVPVKFKQKTLLPSIRDNNISLRNRKSNLYIEPLSQNDKSMTSENNNITEYNSNKKTSYSVSQFVSPKTENNEINEKGIQVKDYNYISLKYNKNHINYDKSQFLMFQKNKLINLKQNHFFSPQKTSRNYYGTFFSNVEEEKKPFNLSKYKSKIDSNSDFLKTQICKLTGMKKYVPKKEINFHVFDDNDKYLIQIQSDPNQYNGKRNKRNQLNLFLTSNNNSKTLSKKYPRALTEIDLKDFRNIRKKKHKF